MNKKLIVAAVGASLVPIGAQAQATFYGRINNAIHIDEHIKDGESNTDISGVASRFGFKYSGDIGGGYTARGRYESSTTTDKEGPGANDTRIATVGLSGDFGTIDVGQQWSTYYNTFGMLVSPTYTLGYYLYSSVGGGPFRASNTIQYSNTFGPLFVSLDARLNDSKEPGADAEKIRGNGFGFGASLPLGALTLAAAVDAEQGVDDGSADGSQAAPDTDRVGVAAKLKLGGGLSIQGGWQNYNVANDNTVSDNELTIVDESTANETDIDSMFIWLNGSFSPKTSWALGYSMANDGVDAVAASSDFVAAKGDGSGSDADNAAQVGLSGIAEAGDSSQVNWGLYYNMGAGMRLYYEAALLDSEVEGWDGAVHLLGMRVDF